jgi:hypothetical protein
MPIKFDAGSQFDKAELLRSLLRNICRAVRIQTRLSATENTIRRILGGQLQCVAICRPVCRSASLPE